MPYPRHLGALAAGTLAALALAAPASAATPGLTSAQVLQSPGTDSQGSVLATDGAGRTTAIWTAGGGFHAATHEPNSDGWSAPVPIPTSAESGVPSAGYRLAADRAGNLVALWQSDFQHVWASRKPLGGAWQAPEPVASGAFIFGVELGVDDSGRFVAAFANRGAQAVLLQTTASSGWSALHAVGDDVEDVALDVSPRGRVAALYTTRDLTPHDESVRVETVTQDPSGAWEAERLAEAGGRDGYPQEEQPYRLDVEVTDAGAVAAAWGHDQAAGSIYAAYRPGGAAGFEPITHLVELQGYEPTIAFRGSEPFVAWTSYASGGEASLRFVRRTPAGDGWSPAEPASQDGVARESAQLASGRDGSLYLLGERLDPYGVDLLIPVTDGSFHATPVAGAGGRYPSMAVDDEGNVALSYSLIAYDELLDPTSWDVVGRGYDAAGPTLGAPTVPSLLAGSAGTFAVEARDTWSQPAVTWAFGDGASATGARAQHAYAAGGTFAGTVTATDGRGFTARRAVSASVAARPADDPSAADTTAPAVTLARQPRRLTRKQLRTARTLAVTVSEPGPVRAAIVLAAERPVVLARGRATAVAPGPVEVVVRPTKAGRRALRTRRAGRLEIRVAASDAAGNTRRLTRKLALAR